MRRIALLLLALLALPALARSPILRDHSRIQALSYFTMQGCVELREAKDSSSAATYLTLNHEGGLQVRVLELLEHDVYEGESGRWIYVLLTAPVWSSSGELLGRNRRFLVFLPEDTPVFDYEE
ncbi:MAG TPA: hypothetical protein DDW78_03765 [Treponema sp.]|nr:hypothetical protein [Treponema sp.]